MADTFKEYLIKQKKSSKDNLLQAAIVMVAVILVGILLIVGGSFLGPILIIAVVFGAGFLFSKFSREYEYILTNNELDIDVIYNKAKRKRVMTIDMKKIDIMASIEDQNHKADINKSNAKLINASDNNNKGDTYAIIVQKETGLCKVLITPNESFLKELHRQAPHKVFKRM